MSWDELQTLYRNAQPGQMPCGYVRGRAVYDPCERFSAARTKIANCMWKGKHFCDDGGLVNQWAVGRAVRASTYVGTSWIDGKPSLIFDYADSPVIWRGGRDETREVAPGLYVGAMHMRGCPEPRLMNMFILEARPCGR